VLSSGWSARAARRPGYALAAAAPEQRKLH